MALNERMTVIEGIAQAIGSGATSTLNSIDCSTDTGTYIRIVVMVVSNTGHAWAIVKTMVLNQQANTIIGTFNEIGPAHSFSASAPTLTVGLDAGGILTVQVTNNLGGGGTLDAQSWLYKEELVIR